MTVQEELSYNFNILYSDGLPKCGRANGKIQFLVKS